MTTTDDEQTRQRGMTSRGLRLLAEYFAMHPVVLSVAIGGAAIYAACTVGSSIVLGRVTDSVIVPGLRGEINARTVVLGIVAVLAVAVGRAGGILVRRFCAGIAHARVGRDLRLRVTDRYAALPVAYHRSQPTGDLLAHVHADVEAAADIVGPFPYSTAVVLMILIAVVALIVTDPILALIGCTLLPGLAVLNRVFTRLIEQPALDTQRSIGRVSAVAHESVDGALVVKTLGREADETRRFETAATRLRDARIRMGQVRASFEPGLDALPDLAVVVLVAVGAWRISTGAITTGTLVQFLSLFQLLAFPMRLIGFLLAGMPRAVVGRGRIEEVLATPVAHRTGGTRTLPPGSLGLEVRDLDFAYGDTAVLSGVSLQVRAGEAVAVVGQTGSGKSTLVQLLVRLAEPRRGSISVGGVEVRGLAAAELSGAVAAVFQEAFLFGTTLRENITLGAAIDDDEVLAAAHLAQADSFIGALPEGLDTRVGERGVTLSGGQRQRVALARALVRRPRLLILDDATSAVDPTVEARILDGLRRRRELTLVVVAHRVSTIRLADQVVLLEGGRISAAGSHAELLAMPAYSAMVRAYELDSSIPAVGVGDPRGARA